MADKQYVIVLSEGTSILEVIGPFLNLEVASAVADSVSKEGTHSILSLTTEVKLQLGGT